MQTCSTVELGDKGIVMASIGVRQSTRLAMFGSLVSIAALAMGPPASGHIPVDHIAASQIAVSQTPDSESIIQPLCNPLQQATILAQTEPLAQSDSGPNATETASEPVTPGEPEREIEFTSPTFSIGVQGEGVAGEGTQGDADGVQGSPNPGTAVQGPLEAGAQQDVTATDEADGEALAAQHDWVEFSVEDSNEAIARYGCDDLYCINALREQRGLPPLQLVWDAQNSNANPQ